MAIFEALTRNWISLVKLRAIFVREYGAVITIDGLFNTFVHRRCFG